MFKLLATDFSLFSKIALDAYLPALLLGILLILAVYELLYLSNNGKIIDGFFKSNRK